MLAVTGLTATPGNGSLALAWTPASVGSGTFARYELYVTPQGTPYPGTPAATLTYPSDDSYVLT